MAYDELNGVGRLPPNRLNYNLSASETRLYTDQQTNSYSLTIPEQMQVSTIKVSGAVVAQVAYANMITLTTTFKFNEKVLFTKVLVGGDWDVNTTRSFLDENLVSLPIDADRNDVFTLTFAYSGGLTNSITIASSIYIGGQFT